MEITLTVFVGIVTILVAIMAFAVTIPKIVMTEQNKKLKQALKEYETLKNEYKNLRSSLDYILFKANYIDDKNIERIEQIKYGKTQNNCGLYYLGLSRNNSLSMDKKKIYEQKALSCFQLALELAEEKNDKAIICVNLADLYDDINDPSNAIKYCEQALLYKENCDQAYSMLASIHLSAGEIIKARKYAETAKEYNNSNGYAYLTLAETYFNETDIEEYKNDIYENIKKALDLGCPVWDFCESEIYENIRKHNKIWDKCLQQINEYYKNYNIVKMTIKSESDYTL